MKKELKVTLGGLRSMCRICLTTTGRLANIFCRSLSLKSSIAVALMECASVKIVRGDGVPPLICGRCYGRLKEVHQFRTQCKRADAIVHRYAQQLNVINAAERKEKNSVLHLTKLKLLELGTSKTVNTATVKRVEKTKLCTQNTPVVKPKIVPSVKRRSFAKNRATNASEPTEKRKRRRKDARSKEDMNLQVSLGKSDVNCQKTYNVIPAPFQNNNSHNNLLATAHHPPIAADTSGYCDSNGMQQQIIPTATNVGMATNESSPTAYSNPPATNYAVPAAVYESPIQNDYIPANTNNVNYNTRNQFPAQSCSPNSNAKPVQYQPQGYPRNAEETAKPDYIKCEPYQLVSSENEEYLDESVERILNGIIRCSDSQTDHSDSLYPRPDVAKSSETPSYPGEVQVNYLNKNNAAMDRYGGAEMFAYGGSVPYNGSERYPQDYGSYGRTAPYEQRSDYDYGARPQQYGNSTYPDSQPYLGENYGNNYQQYPSTQPQYVDYNADNSNYSFDNSNPNAQYVGAGEYQPYSGSTPGEYANNGLENSSWMSGQFDGATPRTESNSEERREDSDGVKKKRPRASVKRPRKRQEDGAETDSGNPEERPFVCDVCNKTFKHSSNLLQHKKIHSGIRVECDVCKKYFSRKTTLKIHYQKFHSGVEQTTPAE